MLTSEYAPTQQAGNGVIVAFNFSIKILAASDLVVSKIDANGVSSGTLILGTDYTVTFDPIAETGTVTYTVAPVSGGYSLIERSSNDQQQTSLPREGNFPAKTVETMIDKLALRMQELEYALSLIVLTSTPIQINTDVALQAAAAAAPTVPFIGIFLTTRTIQIYLGDVTRGTSGWSVLGGF